MQEPIYEPKTRVQCGNYRFVEINPNTKMPIFKCCPNHDGDSDYCLPYKVTDQLNIHQTNTDYPRQFPVESTHDYNYDKENIVPSSPVRAHETSNGWQQPVDNGWHQPANNGWHQPANNGWQQPTDNGRQQPVGNGWQQPVDIVPDSIMIIENQPIAPTNNFIDSFDEEIVEVEPVFESDISNLNASKFGFPSLNDSLEVIHQNPTVITVDDKAYDSFEDDDGFLEVVDFNKSDNDNIFYVSPQGQRHDMHGQFKTYLKDDGDFYMNSREILGPDMNQRMYRVLKNVFGHNDFRFRQKAAIVAILNDQNCFILMPTGAGKSLCYQLPAVLSPGLTVVISPLISLIEDQVTKLQALKVNAKTLKGNTDSHDIYNELNATEVTLKLLYVTPEMIGKSMKFLGAMQSLHRRGLLSRIVVDEAHCISQWGHDFRPDYTRLNKFIDQFNPRVPIVALTASATPKIVTDIRAHLSVQDSKLFMSSFVRDNLKYDVAPKSQHALNKLIKELKIKYGNSPGIVYCLSQKDCDVLTELFRKEGFSAAPYHAGLNDNVRSTTQTNWMHGKINVICATIAFGMGIDKPNVRFVVHHSLPKSIEGYYQETGRAGRDGNSSYCILLYSYQDHIRIRKMQESKDNNSSLEIRKEHKQALYEMVNYCENVSTCRRKMLVEHFGEIYDTAACQACKTPCSICEDMSNIKKRYQLYDITEDSKSIIKSIQMMGGKIAISYGVELYRGVLARKNQKKAADLNHISYPLYGKGNALNEQDATRLFRKLVIDGFLDEHLNITQHGSAYGHLFASDKGRKFVDGAINPPPKVYIHLAHDQKKQTATNVKFSMVKVSESAALKEKYRLKHEDLFRKCKEELLKFFQQAARNIKLSTYVSIISHEGLEQLAALMPRTNSELLRIDSMTRDKVTTYSPQIMNILKPYWAEVDKREHESIQHQINELKKATAAHLSSIPTPSNSSLQSGTPIYATNDRNTPVQTKTYYKKPYSRKTGGVAKSRRGAKSKTPKPNKAPNGVQQTIDKKFMFPSNL